MAPAPLDIDAWCPLFLAILSLGACGPEEPRIGSSGGPVFDSAGVHIVTSDVTALRKPLGWSVATAPFLRVGGAAASLEAAFYEVHGARRLTDGRIVVLDAGVMGLTFFGPRGQFIGRQGEPGQGPGEYQSLALVPSPGAPDSLLVWDWRQVRLHRVRPDQSGAEPIYFPGWETTGQPPPGRVHDRVLFTAMAVDWAAGVFDAPLSEHHSFEWRSIEDGRITPVLGVDIEYFYIRKNSKGYPTATHIPFTVRPSAAVHAQGALIALGPSAEILDYGTDGRLRRILRVEEPCAPTTPAMVWSFAEKQEAEGRGAAATWMRRYDPMPIPDSLPIIQDLVVDDLGWIWAQRFDWRDDAPGKWIVFDPDGHARGSVLTPPGLRVHQIGADFVLGVARDELEAEVVVAYRLTRSGQESTAEGGERQ